MNCNIRKWSIIPLKETTILYVEIIAMAKPEIIVIPDFEIRPPKINRITKIIIATAIRKEGFLITNVDKVMLYRW